MQAERPTCCWSRCRRHFAEIPVGPIRPNPKQPRQVFDEDEMAELVHSIKEIGVLQPIVVRPAPDGSRAASGPATPTASATS